MGRHKNPETTKEVKQKVGLPLSDDEKKLPDIQLKTRAELTGEMVNKKYHEALEAGEIINSENALESARVRYEALMRKAKDKKQREKLEKEFRKIEHNLTPRPDTPPPGYNKKAMVTI